MEADSEIKDSIGIQECEFRNYDEESVTKPNRNPYRQTTHDILAFNYGKDRMYVVFVSKMLMIKHDFFGEDIFSTSRELARSYSKLIIFGSNIIL